MTTDISLAKKQDGSWNKSEKEKAEIFAEHLSKVLSLTLEGDYTRGRE